MMVVYRKQFSTEPPGNVWVCSRCRGIHIQYGTVSWVMPRDIVEMLVNAAAEDDLRCEGCPFVHLPLDEAIINMPVETFRAFCGVCREAIVCPFRQEKVPRFLDGKCVQRLVGDNEIFGEGEV